MNEDVCASLIEYEILGVNFDRSSTISDENLLIYIIKRLLSGERSNGLAANILHNAMELLGAV